MRIQKTRTTSYHSQSNGPVERTNHATVIILHNFICRHQSYCPDEIPLQCPLAYNCAAQSGIRYTPSLPTLGQELCPKIGILTQLVTADSIGLPWYVRKFSVRLSVSRKIAAQHYSQWQHHQKSCYVRRPSGSVYPTGDRA
ncbi:uncharacterized protein DEA37_0000332 [Paragonimus westermani]|uniref:Integrase catalytic domain-containing protein n=1 Tax=Paragonimus westermani TaxID=34504 RepID=A0A5J4NJ58_9TREM|nr:uncharacterized protein DEA37_0000332 [Paragonimus westermani]